MENSNGGDTNVGSIGNSIKNERSSIEETIKIIERKIKEAEHYTDITGLYLTLDKELCNAFINILSDYKKMQEEFRQVDHECDRLEKIDFEKDMKIKELQKENEELKNQEVTARKINELLVQRYSNSISKSKLKDIIDRIDYDIKKTKEIISKNTNIYASYRKNDYQIVRLRAMNTKSLDIKKRLQELLESEE